MEDAQKTAKVDAAADIPRLKELKRRFYKELRDAEPKRPDRNRTVRLNKRALVKARKQLAEKLAEEGHCAIGEEKMPNVNDEAAPNLTHAPRATVQKHPMASDKAQLRAAHQPGLGQIDLDLFKKTPDESLGRIEAAGAQTMVKESLDPANKRRLKELQRGFYQDLRLAETAKPNKNRESRLYKRALSMARQQQAKELAEGEEVARAEGQKDAGEKEKKTSPTESGNPNSSPSAAKPSGQRGPEFRDKDTLARFIMLRDNVFRKLMHAEPCKPSDNRYTQLSEMATTEARKQLVLELGAQSGGDGGEGNAHTTGGDGHWGNIADTPPPEAKKTHVDNN